jgi:hypothetical protein
MSLYAYTGTGENDFPDALKINPDLVDGEKTEPDNDSGETVAPPYSIN